MQNHSLNTTLPESNNKPHVSAIYSHHQAAHRMQVGSIGIQRTFKQEICHSRVQTLNVCIIFSKNWSLYRSMLFWTMLGHNILWFAMYRYCCNFVGPRLMINWRQCSNWYGKLNKCLWSSWYIEVCSKSLLEDLRMWKMVGGMSDELATRTACFDGC